ETSMGDERDSVRQNSTHEESDGGRTITRRDFLNGVSVAVGASLVAGSPWVEALGVVDSPFAPQKEADYYPSAKTGMRGSHDGSWEVAHDLRDGKQWPEALAEGEKYDLIVVGGGISGLAAAYFFRKFAGKHSRILILDNHDDFGGHAKRNEFRSGNRLLLGYGGTQSIEAPANYSAVSKELLRQLGIDVKRFYNYYDQKLFSNMKLNEATFFDKETFGEDRLVMEEESSYLGPRYSTKIVAQMPIAPEARRDLIRLQDAKVDYLPGLTPEQKRIKLIQKSYKLFLLRDVKVHADVVKVFQTTTHDLYAVGIDAVCAYDCAQYGFPGFAGMRLPKRGTGDEAKEEEPYIFHFPDGNASIARLLVRSLVPGSATGNTMEDIVTARMNYAKLDDPECKVRIRLNSTAVHAKHIGDPESATEVEVTYVREGQARRVRATSCVLACYNMVIPYLCPEMPDKQKKALAYAVKIPLVYVNVQIRNWKSFQNLGLSSIYAPGGYFSNIALDYPVSMGGYNFPASPDEPCLLHLLRTPCQPGLPCKEQYRAGRWELFTTTFDTFEHQVRDQLGRMLSAGGFDPVADIEAITVNRWPHGYAYEYNRLFEPLDRPDSERPCVTGRQPFGRITIANSDADGHAYTNIAIDQGHRAVKEIMAMRGAPTG
ncbi:MAG TPA: FAD/NAD(P)-binding protein, partial [Candidatus Sulfotelmatobacter sp.]